MLLLCLQYSSVSICLVLCKHNYSVFFVVYRTNRYQSWPMCDTCVVVCSWVWICLFACLLYWRGAVRSLITGFKVCKHFVASLWTQYERGQFMADTFVQRSLQTPAVLAAAGLTNSKANCNLTNTKQARDRHAQKLGLKSRIFQRLLVA